MVSGTGRAMAKAHKERLKQHIKSTPPELPHRRRDLSHPPTGRTLLGKKRRMIQQTCALFARIPPELRTQIFSEVLGHQVVHLLSLTRRVGHVECTQPSECGLKRTCPSLSGRLGVGLGPVFDDYYDCFAHSSRSTALLRTCRQAYIEAIDLLYSTNTFDFAHGETFLWFARTVRPQRLAAITSLQIGWFAQPWHGLFRSPRATVRHHPLDLDDPVDLARNWDPVWRIVATRMPRLRSLRVRLEKVHQRDLSWKEEEEEMLLVPLLQLRGLREFELVVAESEKWGAPAYLEKDLSPLGKRLKGIVTAKR